MYYKNVTEFLWLLVTFDENKYENTWVQVAVILWNNQTEKDEGTNS